MGAARAAPLIPWWIMNILKRRVRCGVCCLCVARLGTRKLVSVCTFKTLPCVPTKRTHTETFLTYTRRGGKGSGERILFSLFLSAVVLVLCSSFSSLFPLLSSLFSLSNNDNGHSSSRLSLWTHGSNLPECQSACTLAHSLFGDHIRSYHARDNCPGFYCANLVPLGMKWACICAGNGCCVWWCLWCVLCLAVFGCVWLCEHALLCDSMCCLRCVAACVSVGVDALAVVWWWRFKKTKTKSGIPKNIPRQNLSPLRFSIHQFFFQKKKTHYITVITDLYWFEKNKICTTNFCNHFRANGTRQSSFNSMSRPGNINVFQCHCDEDRWSHLESTRSRHRIQRHLLILSVEALPVRLTEIFAPYSFVPALEWVLAEFVASSWQLCCASCNWEYEFFSLLWHQYFFHIDSPRINFWCVHLFQFIDIRNHDVSFSNFPREQCTQDSW